MRMKHWLRSVMPDDQQAREVAEKIEDADERISNLKIQIQAVQERRAQLESEARGMVNSDTEAKVSASVAKTESATLDCVQATANILQSELHRLYVQASPFLSELVEPELANAGSLCQKLARWKSMCQ